MAADTGGFFDVSLSDLIGVWYLDKNGQPLPTPGQQMADLSTPARPSNPQATAADTIDRYPTAGSYAMPSWMPLAAGLLGLGLLTVLMVRG